MTVAAASLSGNRRKGFASRFAVLVTVFAFAMQAFIAQTHIHGDAHNVGVAAKLVVTHGQGKVPLDNSRENCPLCQAVSHAGAFLASVTPLLFVPFWVQFAAPVIAAHAVTTVTAHNWRSRAPPRR